MIDVNILKHGGRVYSKMIPNAQTASLLPILQTKVELDSVVYTDAFGRHDILDVSGFHRHRINVHGLFATLVLRIVPGAGRSARFALVPPARE